MPPPSDPKPAADRPDQGKRCPICGQSAAEDMRPFCSARCRDVDLNRWLSGSYVIPARDDEPDDAD
jgi:endogenous inhibitor of DNA gyrase (YacG/DUF329 family)